MMILSSRWPSFLCTAIVFLGWFGPVIGAVETSNIYKVLTKADNMGGECDDILPKVNAMAPEVQKLVGAAINAIELILRDPTLSERTDKNSQGKNRERILLLARQIFGAEFGSSFLKSPSKYLKLDKDSNAAMTTVKGQIQDILSCSVLCSYSTAFNGFKNQR